MKKELIKLTIDSFLLFWALVLIEKYTDIPISLVVILFCAYQYSETYFNND
jgi:hypothetical protein